mmetsp:Transcript_15016/g.21023  ORF Transcript_15016/g.21023 Transcript_15016/m.21023 type:complete len:343 (-) Transcript_15016:848-1876(-)
MVQINVLGENISSFISRQQGNCLPCISFIHDHFHTTLERTRQSRVIVVIIIDAIRWGELSFIPSLMTNSTSVKRIDVVAPEQNGFRNVLTFSGLKSATFMIANTARIKVHSVSFFKFLEHLWVLQRIHTFCGLVTKTLNIMGVMHHSVITSILPVATSICRTLHTTSRNITTIHWNDFNTSLSSVHFFSVSPITRSFQKLINNRKISNFQHTLRKKFLSVRNIDHIVTGVVIRVVSNNNIVTLFDVRTTLFNHGITLFKVKETKLNDGDAGVSSTNFVFFMISRKTPATILSLSQVNTLRIWPTSTLSVADTTFWEIGPFREVKKSVKSLLVTVRWVLIFTV